MESEKKKKVCKHEGSLTLYRSRLDNKYFFHCATCRTALDNNFETLDSAQKYAKRHFLPEYRIDNT